MNIDVKKFLYKYPKLVVGLANINNSINRLTKQYPSCVPSYRDDIQGRGGLPSSQTERFALHNVLEIGEKQEALMADADEYQYAINLIQTALNTLNERQRELIELYYFRDKEPLAAANSMSISLSRFYHLHGIAVSGVEQCLNQGNIFVNKLIPTKNNKKHNKNTRVMTAKSMVS